jgi:glucose/arabinose dehydrogenase
MRSLYLSVSLSALCVVSAAQAQSLRTGKDAYGDWHSDAPGVMRKITAADVQAPVDASGVANRSKVVAKPENASLATMDGFSVTPFAKDIVGARVLRVAPNGDIFVSQSRPQGKVSILRPSKDGSKAEVVSVFAEGMKDPYGIAFYPPGPKPKWVYVAMEGKIVRFPYKNGDLKASGAPETIVDDIIVGPSHWTRDVAFSHDGKIMYVAVGSGSNVATDTLGPRPADMAAFEKSHARGSAWGKEEYRSNVLTYSPEGKNKKVFATGIRNCSGLMIHPMTDEVYCATNERDLLGDNTPPDYVTHVQKGGFYGWPWFYIGAHEDNRPMGGGRPDLRDKVIVPDVLLQPHSAPLGMAFNTGSMFPDSMRGDAFVALHGSWNRSLHTGYKIIRVPFKHNRPEGVYQDFVTGFTAGDDNVWGRPVDVIFAKDGSMLFSEDGNGVVYRVSYSKPKK